MRDVMWWLILSLCGVVLPTLMAWEFLGLWPEFRDRVLRSEPRRVPRSVRIVAGLLLGLLACGFVVLPFRDAGRGLDPLHYWILAGEISVISFFVSGRGWPRIFAVFAPVLWVGLLLPRIFVYLFMP